jgi:hypothetical protein
MIRRRFLPPVTVAYGVSCLLGLVAGLYPGAIHPAGGTLVVLPTLQTIAVAQLAFALLAWPVLRRPAPPVDVPVMLLAGAPLLVPAAWLADATLQDVVRTECWVLAVWTLPAALGPLLVRRAWRTGSMLTLLAVAIGLPGAWYIAREFLPVDASTLWRLAPLTNTWTVAAPRQAAWLPDLRWSLPWPALAACAALAGRATRSRRDRGGGISTEEPGQ